MTSPTHDILSRREREIMNAIFALGNRASAEDIRTRLIDPPGYSAVRAMLVRLEAKGYIRHDLYVQEIFADFPEQLKAAYGPGLDKLVTPYADAGERGATGGSRAKTAPRRKRPA